MGVAYRKSSRVALLLPTLTGGGAERVTINLIEGLRELVDNIDLVLFTAEGELGSAVPDDVETIDLRCRRAARAPMRLADYLRDKRPDVLISALGHTNLVALLARALARAPTKLVITEHGTLNRAARGYKERAYRLLARAFYPRADAVVAVSEGVASSLSKGIGLARERIIVVANPVLTSQFRESLGFPVHDEWYGVNRPPVILGVGRLVPEKDFPTLLRAFARVRETSDANLLILGDGPERGNLEALTGELGLADAVRLPGFVDHTGPYMAGAGVFVLSSISEGLPTVLIEALATGVPVVATDCESGPREILRGGALGKLVPVSEPDTLASAILEAIASPTSPVAADLSQYTPLAAAELYLEAAGLHG